MNSRERIIMALNHEEGDRVPITDNLWTAAIERWRKEGLPAEVTPSEYFGYENIGFDSDTSPRFPVEVVSEDDK